MTQKISYDSFNARYLSYQEIADSFIESEYFEELQKNNHSLLMGARGCGKTTLLKMLTPAALSFWDKKQKSNKFETLPFIGIYIPTDIHWKKQLEQLRSDFEDDRFVQLISKGSVTINILTALIKTFADTLKILQYENEDERIKDEIEISKTIIDSWELNKPVAPNFDSIEMQLNTIITNANSELKKIRFFPDYKFNYHPILFKEFFDLVRTGSLAFEKKCSKFSTKRWALCFDELEIAPEWLQFELLQYLRSRDQNIIFKLTTAPIISLIKAIQNKFTAIDATENNDFAVIKVWTSNQSEFKKWTKFCNNIIKSRLSRKFETSIQPEEIFGFSHLDRAIQQSFQNISFTDGHSDFAEGTLTWHITRQLAKIDQTFYNFLKKRNINPDNPAPTTEKQKNEVFRKMKQLVVYRFQFRKEGKSFRRSRKVIPLYYGIPLIYELSDGNPRILIDMIDKMIELAKLKAGSYRQLTINEQSRIATEASSRFLLVLSSHPDANVTVKDKNVNIIDIIEEIGNYFHNEMINADFSIDPSGSFRVDEDINNKYIDLLQLGLYLGAIVYLESHEIFATKGIIGKRFRLSYILSPNFGLLSREYKEVQLSSILKKNISFPSSQQNLFKQ